MALIVGCGDSTSTSDSATDGSSGSTSTTTGTTTTSTTTSTTTTTSGTASETGTTTTTSTTTTDDGTTTGEPLACAFSPGCHKPTLPAKDRGVASDVPLGCDGDDFTVAWSIGVGQSGLADPEAPRAIPLLADFNDDEHLDLFVNMRKSGAAAVIPGKGDGTFDLGASAPLAGGLFSGGWGGDAGDFNGDGVLDVFVGDHVRGAYAWTGAPGLMFTAAIAGLPPPSDLFSGGGLLDFDGDGTLDAIVGADQFHVGLRAFKGGGGAWTEIAPPPGQAKNAGHFVAFDHDDDGDLDVFVFADGTGVGVDVFILTNDGAGGFTLTAQLEAGGPNQLNADPVQGGVGDVNCDGVVDIAAGGSIFLGVGGSWSLATAVNDAHISHLADMNGDGHLDLVTQDPAFGIAVHLGDGSGTGWSPLAAGLPDASYTFGGQAMDTAYGLDVGDLDGDDRLDIVRLAGFGSEYALEAWVR